MFYIKVMVLSLVVATETDLHAGGHSAPAETDLYVGGYITPAETVLHAGGYIAPAETVLHASITRLKEKLPLYHGVVVEFNYYQ
jgi:hypothetical protein